MSRLLVLTGAADYSLADREAAEVVPNFPPLSNLPVLTEAANNLLAAEVVQNVQVPSNLPWPTEAANNWLAHEEAAKLVANTRNGGHTNLDPAR